MKTGHSASVRVLFIIIWAVFAVLTSSCVKKDAAGGKKILLASFYPIYIMTKNVAADVPGVEVKTLAPFSTGCLHDYSMKPDDRILLDRADVFIINGLGMESFLEKAVESTPSLKIIDSSAGIIPLVDPVTKATNPHLWVSISDAMLQVRNIAEGLAKVDPTNAAAYRSNAVRYVNKLAELDKKVRAATAGLKKRDIVTFHEAFPYFASEFGLRIAAVVEREPGSEPSAKELSDTVNLIKKLRVKAVFAEPQYTSRSAETIARETGAKVYILDPAVTGEDSPDAYLKTMEKNIEVLKEALR